MTIATLTGIIIRATLTERRLHAALKCCPQAPGIVRGGMLPLACTHSHAESSRYMLVRNSAARDKIFPNICSEFRELERREGVAAA